MRNLDSLEEMIHDTNYLVFNQHLFGEFNGLEAALLDQWFNSHAIDLLS